MEKEKIDEILVKCIEKGILKKVLEIATELSKDDESIESFTNSLFIAYNTCNYNYNEIHGERHTRQREIGEDD